MTAVFIVVAVLVALVVAAVVYWQVVSAKYTMPVRADEIHYVTAEDGWKVRLCRYLPQDGSGEPVFLCHGALTNQFNVTLPEGASIVDALVKAGYDCWAIDFRGARSSLPPEGVSRRSPKMEDFPLKDAPAAIEYIRRETGYGKIHWIGHSMGGMTLYAYDLVYGSEYVASGTVLGSPPGFEGAHLRSRRWLIPIIRIMPSFWESLLRSLAPLHNVWKPRNRYVPINWDNMHEAISTQAYFNLPDILAIPALEDLDRAASQNKWELKAGALEVFSSLDQLQVPIFGVFAVDDPFVPVRNAERFIESLSHEDKRLLILSNANGHSADYSHVDLLFAKNGMEEVYEPIIDWMAAHPIRTEYEPTARERATAHADTNLAVAAKTTLRRIVAAKEVLSQLEGDKPAATESAPAPVNAPKEPSQPTGRTVDALSASAKFLDELDESPKPAPKKKQGVKNKTVTKKVAAKNTSTGRKTSTKTTTAKKKKASGKKKKAGATKKAASKKGTSPRKAGAKKKATAKKRSTAKITASAKKKTGTKKKAAAKKKKTAAKKKSSSKKKGSKKK